MRSLLTALCALSENTGHSFTPLVQPSGSVQEGAQLFSNCVINQQWYKFGAEWFVFPQLNLLQ